MIKKIEAESLQPLDSFFTRHQLASLLGVSIRTLRRMERRGQLDPIHVSSRLVRYKASQIRTLLANAGGAS